MLIVFRFSYDGNYRFNCSLTSTWRRLLSFWNWWMTARLENVDGRSFLLFVPVILKSRWFAVFFFWKNYGNFACLIKFFAGSGRAHELTSWKGIAEVDEFPFEEGWVWEAGHKLLFRCEGKKDQFFGMKEETLLEERKLLKLGWWG